MNDPERGPAPAARPRSRARGRASRSAVPERLLQRLYDLCYLLFCLLGAPAILVMMAVSPRWRAGLPERFLGLAPRRKGDRPCVWIHGVSVGEVLAAKTLAALIREELPDWEVVLSSTTRTGNEVARRHFPGSPVFYFPLDFSFATERVLRRVRPDAVLLVELEIWPNFLLSTSRRGVPVFLVNGRISGRSVRGYRVLQAFIPEPMDRIGLYCVQTPTYRDRFLSLGVPPDRVFVTGTMKFDTVDTEGAESQREAFARLLGISGGDWVLVAGSTHHGEEEAVLRAFRAVADRDPRARLVLVPRHLERLAAVEAAVRAAGFRPLRRTRLPAGGDDGGAGRAVVILDTMGELASLYAVADLVFVGGSLVRHGGQNVMEPAGFGMPVVIGPHHWNFEEVVEVLRASGGLEVVPDADALAAAVARLHDDRVEARRRGASARGAVLANKGATRRILDLVRERIEDGART